MGLRADGTLWVWGYNGSGQLGLGDLEDRYSPTRLGNSANWSAVSTDGWSAHAIRSDGTLWAWGDNFRGQLGLGDNLKRDTPTRVGSASNWAAVSASSSTLALRSDGTLWAWGFNSSGQLGLGDEQDRNSPAQVGSDSNWAAAIAGSHALALRSDGTLWTWGSNRFGQLGLGDHVDSDTPAQVGLGTNWSAISSGDFHCQALQSDGTIWGWGAFNYGEQGTGPEYVVPTLFHPESGWRHIASRGGRTLALRDNGSLWFAGENSSINVMVPINGDQDHLIRIEPPAPGQSILFPAIPFTPAGNSIQLTASASSGLPVTYSVTGPATLSGSILSITGAGTIQVKADQAGDSVWPAAAQVMQTLVVPLLHVSGNQRLINSGDVTPSVDDHTHFESVRLLNTRVVRTFMIGNSGTAVVNLTAAARVNLSGAHAADFKLVQSPASSLPPGSSTTFAISFDPRLPGLRSATVSIPVSGGSPNPFTFVINGNGSPDMKQAQAITFVVPKTIYLDQGFVRLQAHSSSGMPVTLTLKGDAASLAGNNLAPLAVGKIKVTATQPGDAIYAAAKPITRTITVRAF
jgi:hypothetical protein